MRMVKQKQVWPTEWTEIKIWIGIGNYNKNKTKIIINHDDSLSCIFRLDPVSRLRDDIFLYPSYSTHVLTTILSFQEGKESSTRRQKRGTGTRPAPFP